MQKFRYKFKFIKEFCYHLKYLNPLIYFMN